MGSSDPTGHLPVVTRLAEWMHAMDGEKQTSTVIHIKLRLQLFVLEFCHVTLRKLKIH